MKPGPEAMAEVAADVANGQACAPLQLVLAEPFLLEPRSQEPEGGGVVWRCGDGHKTRVLHEGSTVNRKGPDGTSESYTSAVTQTLGDRLQIALDDRGMTQNELEKKLSLNAGHINKIVHSKRGRIDPELLLDIARALGVRTAWLAKGTEPMDDPEVPRPQGSRAAKRSPRRTSGPEASPPAPPISETRTVLDAVKDMIDAVYDPERHMPSDAMLVSEGLMVGAPLLKSSVDPATYVRRLLDTAARERQRGRKPRGEDLPALAVGLLSDELDESREEVQRMVEMLAETRQWMIDNGIPLPKTGQLAALPPVNAEPPRHPKKPARGH